MLSAQRPCVDQRTLTFCYQPPSAQLSPSVTKPRPLYCPQQGSREIGDGWSPAVVEGKVHKHIAASFGESEYGEQ